MITRDGMRETAIKDLMLFREVYEDSRRPNHINVVEDDVDDFRLMKRHLQSMDGFTVWIAHATTLESACDMAAMGEFHVALVDYWLGADTGPRVLEGLGGRHGPIPTVLVTGLNDDTYKKAAMKAGAIHCLGKDGLNGTILQDTIRSVLHTHSLESAMRSGT